MHRLKMNIHIRITNTTSTVERSEISGTSLYWN